MNEKYLNISIDFSKVANWIKIFSVILSIILKMLKDKMILNLAIR
jgi:hypothetical protein